MNKNWTTTGVSFKYMLSDYCLFAYELRLKVKRFDFRNAGSNTFDIPNEQPLQKGEMGYLLRSLPLDGNQPVIREDKGYYYYIPEKFNRYYIDLRQSFDVYLAKFSSKTRSTMRRKVKKFKVHCNGKMDWQRYQTPEEMRLFYKNARIVSEKSYQEKLLDSGLPNSATFKKKMLDLAHKGFVRGYLLYRDDQPVAYMYCPVDDGVLLYQYLGYDPQYFKWSVGSILHWYAFEDMFKEGCFSYFDFTEGQSDHKRRYSTGSLLCGNVFVFPKNLRCGFIIYSHAGMNWLSQTLGTMFEKMGLKQKIKKFIRFGLKK